MKHLFLLSIITLTFGVSEAQSQENYLPRLERDTLFTSSGFTVTKGQKIKLGMGTMPDGNFKYIYHYLT
jgi:hypothetical protein